LVCTFFTAVIVSLLLTSFIEAYNMTKLPADSLSQDYYSFYIGEDLAQVLEDDKKLTDLLGLLDNSEKSFVLLKESYQQISGVYSQGEVFAPDIISGRSFGVDDFADQSNTALVSTELIEEITIIDGSEMLWFDNSYYEVIGVYQRSNNRVNVDAYAYYNLGSENIISGSNTVLGHYSLDAGAASGTLLNEIDRLYSASVLRAQTDNNPSEVLRKVISAQTFTLASLLLVLVMLMLNTINFTTNWIDGRRQELFVRRITGATNARINLMLLRDYILLTSISFVLGLALAYLISQVSTEVFAGFDFSLIAILITYATTLTLALLSSALMLLSAQSKSLIETRGR